MVAGQPQLIKEVNIDLIKKLIAEKGPISKPMLAKETNLSLPTVNKVVELLEQDGIVNQDGTNSGCVGRRAKMYIINRNAGNIIVLNFVNDQFICTLVDMIGNAIYKETYSLLENNSLEIVYNAISDLIAQSNATVKAIGIAVPGVVMPNNILTSIPSIPSWQGLNLKEIIQSRYGIPTYVENDVKLASVGYFHTHLKDKYSSMVYLYVGKGLGSGIIINHKLYKGYGSAAGEIGYLPHVAHVGNKTLNTSKNLFENQIQSILKVIDCADGSEKEHLKSQYLRLLSLAITSYVCILNPEVIVIRGKHIDKSYTEIVKELVLESVEDLSLPEIIVDNDDKYGVIGIINMCVSNVTSSLQLIQEKGI